MRKSQRRRSRWTQSQQWITASQVDEIAAPASQGRGHGRGRCRHAKIPRMEHGCQDNPPTITVVGNWSKPLGAGFNTKKGDFAD